MITNISTDKLKSGMFIDLSDSFLENPFWKDKFLLKSDKEIKKILKAGIKRINIDTNKCTVNIDGLLELELIEDGNAEIRPDEKVEPPGVWDPEKYLPSEIVDIIMDEDETCNNLTKIISHDYYTYTHSVSVGVKYILLTKKFYADTDLHNTKHLSDILKSTVTQHHEKEDGSGYPFGLKGYEIHPYASICCLADVYDALTAQRSYNKAKPPEEALQIMAKQMSNHYNKDLLNKFLSIFEDAGIEVANAEE